MGEPRASKKPRKASTRKKAARKPSAKPGRATPARKASKSSTRKAKPKAKSTDKSTARPKSPREALESSTGLTRDAAGKFADGNAGGPGGAREGAGRKPDELKRVVREAIDRVAKVIVLQPDKEKGLAAVEKELDTLEACIDALRSIAFSPVTGDSERLRAIRSLLEYAAGKPTATVEVSTPTDLSQVVLNQALAAAGLEQINGGN